jgi:hypothetical protein
VIATTFRISAACVAESLCAFSSKGGTRTMGLSAPARKKVLYRERKLVKTYAVSTSRFSLNSCNRTSYVRISAKVDIRNCELPAEEL